jgi:hypothetical protein
MQPTRTIIAIALLLACAAAPAQADGRRDVTLDNSTEAAGMVLAQLPPAEPGAGTEPDLQRATLVDEDSSNPKGRSYWGSVLWCLNRIRAANGSDDVEILGKLEIPDRELKMILSLRRNADASLPASHVIQLKFSWPAGFDGGGIGQVPGIMMKTTEQARGVRLAGSSAKIIDGLFMIGLADKDRESNVATLTQREWFDLPFVYKTQRRGIIAIEKGPSGRQVFQAAFAAWRNAPTEASGDTPYCSNDAASNAPGLSPRALQ